MEVSKRFDSGCGAFLVQKVEGPDGSGASEPKKNVGDWTPYANTSLSLEHDENLENGFLLSSCMKAVGVGSRSGVLRRLPENTDSCPAMTSKFGGMGEDD